MYCVSEQVDYSATEKNSRALCWAWLRGFLMCRGDFSEVHACRCGSAAGLCLACMLCRYVTPSPQGQGSPEECTAGQAVQMAIDVFIHKHSLCGYRLCCVGPRGHMCPVPTLLVGIVVGQRQAGRDFVTTCGTCTAPLPHTCLLQAEHSPLQPYEHMRTPPRGGAEVNKQPSSQSGLPCTTSSVMYMMSLHQPLLQFGAVCCKHSNLFAALPLHLAALP